MRFILILACVYLTACGSVWVVERRSDGGIIGYKGYNSGDAASKAIAELIPCPYYESVSDRLVHGGSSTVYMPQTNTNNFSGRVSNNYGNSANYSGQYQQTQYVPMQINNNWREFEYRCNGSGQAQADVPSRQTSSSRAYTPAEAKVACESDCKSMYEKQELLASETVASCMKKLCN